MSQGQISPNTSPRMSNGSTEPQPPRPLPGPPSAAPTGTAHNNDALLQERKKWFDDMRGWIMVVAVLVASVTYTTGLSPPGGFWQDDDHHKAGSAILRDKLPRRYTIFFYSNGLAFMASLVIIVLLMNEKFYCNRANVVVLNIIMVLDLASLMIAYAAGSARSFETSIYLIILAVVVLLSVLSSVHFLPHLCSYTHKRAPWINRCLGSGITRYGAGNGSDRAGIRGHIYGEINGSDRTGPAVNSSHSVVSNEG